MLWNCLINFRKIHNKVLKMHLLTSSKWRHSRLKLADYRQTCWREGRGWRKKKKKCGGRLLKFTLLAARPKQWATSSNLHIHLIYRTAVPLDDKFEPYGFVLCGHVTDFPRECLGGCRHCWTLGNNSGKLLQVIINQKRKKKKFN